MKIINRLSISLLVILFITALSCNIEHEVKLKSSSGKTCELLVVINDVHWDTELGDSIKAYFASSQYGLPQDEPLYDVVNIQHPVFSELAQTHRNILIFEVNEKYTSPKVEVKRNVWSQPQVVSHIKSPDRAGLKQVFEENKSKLEILYNKNEIERIHLAYQKITGTAIRKKIKEKFNVDLLVSKDFTIASEAENFIWLKRSIRKADQGILIYKRPYTDTAMFSYEYLYDFRNEITQKHVPGSLPNSYMTIEHRVPLQTRIFRVNDNYTVESRGLWRVENDFMGGPFINMAMLDEKNQNLVVFDGYIFYPSENKRDYLKQLEAVFHSAKF